MADIHVLDATATTVRCIFHFDVPDVDNSVSVSLRASLVASGVGGTTSMTEGTGAGQITTAEKAQIEAGEVFEYAYTMRKDRAQWENRTPAQQLEVLRGFYAEENADLSAQVVTRLAYFGYTAAKE